MFKEWLRLQEVIDPKFADTSALRPGLFAKSQESHPACYFDHEGVGYVTYFKGMPLKDENWGDTGQKYYMVSFQPEEADTGSAAWQKTGLGNAQKAMSNVLACTQQFLQREQPIIFGFEPAYPQLARLYAIIMRKFQQQLEALGYVQLPNQGKQVYFIKREYQNKVAGIYGSVGPLLAAA